MASPHQKKLRIRGSVIITANRLADGAVVHRTKNGGWSTDLAKAEVLNIAEAAEAALQHAQGDGLNVVGPYVAPVDVSEAPAAPGNLREAIRMSGPTIPLPPEVLPRRRKPVDLREAVLAA